LVDAGFPAERFDDELGRGLVFPADGSLQPLRRCRTLARRLTSDGATLFAHSPATEISGGRVVVGRGGRVECDAVVVAVDGGLDRLLADLGVTAAVTHRWAATVGFTPDELPILDQVRPGVWACGGYCGTGNVVGSLCARAAARLAMGGDPDWARLIRPVPG